MELVQRLSALKHRFVAKKRFLLAPWQVVLLLSAYIGILLNGAVFLRRYTELGTTSLTLLAELGLVFTFTALLLSFADLSGKFLARLLIVLLLSISVLASYYMTFFNVVIGYGVVQAVLTTDVDLSKEAERNLKSGTPLLQHYLPFWMANLIERMWLALGIIVAILLPLSRIIPPMYKFRIRSRIFKWYGQLQQIEEQISQNPEAKASLRTELDDLDARVGTISVPLSYADELYALRNNINLVRMKLI